MVNVLPPLTFGPGFVDSQRRIDLTQLRQERQARAAAVLTEAGVGALIVAGADACRYLTGLKGPEFAPDLWYCLFTADSRTVAFQLGGYHTTMPDSAPWIDEWRVARSWLRGTPGVEASRHEARLFAREIAHEMSRLQLDGERLGVVGFDQYAREALSEAGLNVVDGDALLRRAMAVKTPEEILCLRMAGAVTDRMWAAMRSGMRMGMTEQEASAVGRQAGASGGAEEVRSGVRAGGLTAERGLKGTGQFLSHGDLVIANVCGTSYLGYKSCVYRTFVVGREPSKRELEWNERLRARLDAVIAELRPGADTGAAARQFAPATTWGYTDEAEVLTIEIGHGIGMHQYEEPAINRQWSLEFPQELKEGMVLAVESREGAVGEATVRLEHMVVITADGPVVIDRYPTDIIPVG